VTPKLITRLSIALVVVAGAYAATAGFASAGAGRAGHLSNPYPAAIYPPASSWPKWGPPGGCASLVGVQRLGPSAASSAVSAVRHLDGNLANDRRYGDRAYWPVLKETDSRQAPSKRSRRENNPVRVDAVGPAAKSPYARLVRPWCGSKIAGLSESVTVGPGRSEPALDTEYWLIDRRGHWLIWFSNP
jgi:hypothetical protein